MEGVSIAHKLGASTSEKKLKIERASHQRNRPRQSYSKLKN